MVINYSGKKILHTILKKNDFPSKKNYHVIIISYLIISQLPSKKENNFLSKKKSTSKKKTSYTYQKISRFSKRKNLFMPARNKFLQLSEKNKFSRQKNPYNYWKKQFFKQGTSYICLKKKISYTCPKKLNWFISDVFWIRLYYFSCYTHRLPVKQQRLLYQNL